jgi:molecular chaperone GrpE
MTGAEASASAAAHTASGESETSEAGQLRQALTEAQQLASSHKDQYLRAVAEIENVRKRAQRDIENASRYGLEKFAVELLPVLDSLQLAVSNADRADVKSLAEGQAATLKLLVKAFDRLNIREINPEGEPFDP